MKRSIVMFIAVLTLAVSWSDAIAATRPIVPATPHARLVMPLRHAYPAPDRGRTHLLKCVKAHNC